MNRKLFTSFLSVIFIGALCMPKVRNARVKAENFTPSKAECVMEMRSRRVLYERNGDLRLPMASTTKIVTAITVLERCENIKDEVIIPKEAVGIEGSSVYLQEGERYSVEDLLYGLMLRSGNDCATALALYCGGNISKFSSMMNVTAEKCGGLNSRFSNPHGLPQQNHYTTARDLTAITSYAMQNETFRKIVSTKYYEAKNWKNKNKMLSVYEGGIGVKTGYTKQAGRCLVSAAERKGMTLICTVLSCPTTYERSAKLLDDAFEAYSNVLLLGAQERVALQIDGKTVYGISQKDCYYPLLEAEREWVEIVTIPHKKAGKRKKSQEIVGEFQIYLSKRLIFSGNLYKL